MPGGGHTCNVLGVRNLSEGFLGVALQAVRWYVEVLASHPMTCDGYYRGSLSAHPQGITVHTVPHGTQGNRVKIITAFLSVSRAPRRAHRTVPLWVSLEMSLCIEEEQGHVQCSAIFKSDSPIINHPYEMTGF